MKRFSTPAPKPAEARSLPDKRRTTAIEWACVIAVFALTFALRWPFLAESYWIDELHTAWCVADGWDEVAPRAKMGNQQPLYFWALWIWQQIPWPEPFASYPVEVLARLTSLWCVSLSAALITWGSLRYHGSLLAATIAGLFFAFDRNAAFFGTELRPYAAVILGSTAAILFAARIWTSAPRTRARDWVGLHASVLFAILMHVTSLVTLAPLVIALSVSDLVHAHGNPTEFKRRTIRHVLWLAGWMIVGLLIANHQREIWNHRDAWEAFGRPRSLFALWSMWPWVGWTLIPFAFYLLGSATLPFRTGSKSQSDNVSPATAPPAFRVRPASFAALTLSALMISVISGFFLAKFLGVPIWHRRYLIAGLPLGCISLGAWIAALNLRRHYEILAATIAFTSLFTVFFAQGSIYWTPEWSQPGPNRPWLPRVTSYWVHRGEDWRKALRLIAAETTPKDKENTLQTEHHVWIDGYLIEQPPIVGEVKNADLANYLTFPAKGPYSLDSEANLHALGSQTPAEGWKNAVLSKSTNNAHSRHWFLTRSLSSTQREELQRWLPGTQHQGRLGHLYLFSTTNGRD
ncbi:putative membrane protein [Rhodopirellula europaea SH398]|uniref:Putative membrane protein n=1 Tax=Rhodopirellula europaea SH398 TaxID=1263868 RepID=M5S756_9BACT|nr:putative membrane protein [Rhodopirellula europaea SH398]